jgi:hypothetical protein
MRKVLGLFLVALLVLAVPGAALASIGVGVGTGKINVSDKLRAGGIYKLPPVTVFNTGTETANYSMSVTLNQSQPQLKPNPKWFSFSPAQFRLAPGRSQVVTPSINLPVSMPPGDYFAYLEAHPQETAKQGTAKIGVAAATKLSFSVKASNIFFAILYRLLSLYRKYEPWSQVATVLVVAGILISILNKYLLNVRAALKAAWQAGRQRK